MKEALLVIDKEPGPTSFGVVKEVKRSLRGAKVGHTGSLDPFASGVLLLLVGRATKLSQGLINADKKYRATVKLGEATDTLDRTGSITSSGDLPLLTQEKVEEVLRTFLGEWYQVPPAYSAKKIRGVRMYDLARQNICVRRTPIPVQIYSVKLIDYSSPFIEFEVHCSKGTYVRSFADELGVRLGTFAHLFELKRLSCGSFSLADSIKVGTLVADPDRWVQKGYQNYIRQLQQERLLRPYPLQS